MSAQNEFAAKVAQLIKEARALGPTVKKNVMEMLEEARKRVVAELSAIDDSSYAAAQLRTLAGEIKKTMNQFATELADAHGAGDEEAGQRQRGGAEQRQLVGDARGAPLPEMDDAAIIETLTRVKGVGVWTVQMFLMFALQRPNVLPVGDLGVRAAMKKAYGLPELPKPQEMERIAAAWHPYRSIASWYLWRSLENQGAM